MWRCDEPFIGSNIVSADHLGRPVTNCVVQSTGQMQCKVSRLAAGTATGLQAAPSALVIISIIVIWACLLVLWWWGKCTNCLEDESAKARTPIVAGACGVPCWPACW